MVECKVLSGSNKPAVTTIESSCCESSLGLYPLFRYPAPTMMTQDNQVKTKDNGRLAAIRMTLALIVLVAMVAIPASAAVVNFPDPGLETAVRNAIGKPTEDIHDTDLLGLTELDATGSSIANLEGVQYCADLTRLWLYENKIVDISALSGLTNLNSLALGSNNVVDISALSGLADLDSLGLGNNQIVSIAPLVNNAGLDSGDDVDLDHNPLDAQSGSPNMLDIVALRQRGVSVTYHEDCDTCGN